jgi:uncharacterized membrane protein
MRLEIREEQKSPLRLEYGTAPITGTGRTILGTVLMALGAGFILCGLLATLCTVAMLVSLPSNRFHREMIMLFLFFAIGAVGLGAGVHLLRMGYRIIGSD